MSSAILIFMEGKGFIQPIDPIVLENEYFFICLGVEDSRFVELEADYSKYSNVHFTRVLNDYFQGIKMTERLDRFESTLCLMYFTHLKALSSKNKSKNVIWVTSEKIHKIQEIQSLMEQNTHKVLFRNDGIGFSETGGLKIFNYESLTEEMLLGKNKLGVFSFA